MWSQRLKTTDTLEADAAYAIEGALQFAIDSCGSSALVGAGIDTLEDFNVVSSEAGFVISKPDGKAFRVTLTRIK